MSKTKKRPAPSQKSADPESSDPPPLRANPLPRNLPLLILTASLFFGFLLYLLIVAISAAGQ
ncbi:hypothetical protein [Lignipirellula cremea]|nr:hypothetical protein [Lignipirellula cremea]